MNFSLVNQRISDLEDSTLKALKLLKAYQDALLEPLRPDEKQFYVQKIEELKVRANDYQQEVITLKQSLQDAEDSINFAQFDKRFDTLEQDLRLLKGGQIALIGRLDHLLSRYEIGQRLTLETIVRGFQERQQYDQRLLTTSEKLLDAVRDGQLSDAEMQQMWAALEQRILALPPSEAAIVEMIKAELNVSNKLEWGIPLIPGFLEYKGELDLDQGLDLKTLCQRITRKLRNS